MQQVTTRPQPTDGLVVVGLDPSLCNWGMSRGIFVPGQGIFKHDLTINLLDVIQPVAPEGKQVRANSKDLARAEQLVKGALAFVQGAQAVFVEVPVNSQSARGAVSYGVCIGVLAALQSLGTPIFEVTPSEVKLAAVNDKNATKQQMIDWAVKMHPEAPWPKHNGKINASKAEHMADSVGAIYAGINSKPFQQLLAFTKKAA